MSKDAKTCPCNPKLPMSMYNYSIIPECPSTMHSHKYLTLYIHSPGSTRGDQAYIAIGACPSIPGVLSISRYHPRKNCYCDCAFVIELMFINMRIYNACMHDQPGMTRCIATCLSKYPGSTKYHVTIPGSTRDDQAYSHMLVQVSREY